MKKIVKNISIMLNKSHLTIKALKKFYKRGGYTHYTIANIQYNQILNGKKILITGGSTGIGLSIAKKCLSVGASVVITGRSLDKLKEASLELNNPNLEYIVWDISDIKSLNQKLQESTNLLGGDIDILVNNAGVIDTTIFPNVSEEVWDKVYSINSKGLYLLTQEVCKVWLSRKSKNKIKKIINISSQGGFVGATYPYRLTKWDIAGLTQGLGIKLAPEGILVNGIAPGVIATKMQPNIFGDSENIFYPLNPLGRYAFPEEIAELAVFLIGDSSNFIVGQTIVCDGGFSIK